MKLIDALTEKPWLEGQESVVDLHPRAAFDLPTAKVGLRVFLGTLTVVFTLLMVAYSDRMVFANDWRPLHEPWVLWLNTALLFASSIGLQWAWSRADRGHMDGVKVGLLIGAGFAFAFLIGQLVAWQQLVALGYYAATNPANAFFYLITGLHGVHLIGGLVAWGRTAAKVWRGFEVAEVRLSVELCTVYWHFLLVVWMVLFSLMLLT